MNDTADAISQLDIRERLAHIDAMLADHDRKRQESQYAPFLATAQIEQMLADAARKHQETRLAPIALAIGAFTAGAALFGAALAFFKLLG